MKDLKQELEALLTSLNELREAINHSVDLLTNGIEDALKETNAEPEEQKPTVRRVPFDIEKAKQGAKIVTRDGGSARIICYDRKSEDCPIVAALTYEGELKKDDEEIITFTNDGRYFDDGDESSYDLFIQEECV